MMNLRFSAQLRRHLLETADERSPEDRLAAVVERVVVTRWNGGFHQRPRAMPSRGRSHGCAARRHQIEQVFVARWQQFDLIVHAGDRPEATAGSEP